MTILAILLLLLGICLVFDGAFTRGLFVTILPSSSIAAVSLVRITEVVIGGMVLVIVGLAFSTC
jgi:hypothetical protein